MGGRAAQHQTKEAWLSAGFWHEETSAADSANGPH